MTDCGRLSFPCVLLPEDGTVEMLLLRDVGELLVGIMVVVIVGPVPESISTLLLYYKVAVE